MMESEWMPAQNADAEAALLGGILLDNDALDDCLAIVTAEDFYVPAHEKLFRSMTELIQGGHRCDAVILAEDLAQRAWLEECGGSAYIASIMDTVFHSKHSEYYARIVRSKSDLRRVHYVLRDGLKHVNKGPEDVAEVVHQVDGQLMQVLERGSGSGTVHIDGAVREVLEEIGRRGRSGNAVPGLSSGFKSIDELTAGFHPGNVIILAARPSMGKTALAGNWAEHMATDGRQVLFVSLEQTRSEIVERMIIARGKVDAHALKTGRMSSKERDSVESAADHIRRLPLFIDDQPLQTIQQIRATARRTKRKHGLAAIFVDYLQLIVPDDKRIPREQQVAEISGRLKGLAKELSVPVIAMAQLNRLVESRADHTPKLADLRESGAIEQDADIIAFLNRPDRFDAADRPGVAEVIIAKNRNGPCGTVELAWQGSWMRFVDAAGSGPHIWTGNL